MNKMEKVSVTIYNSEYNLSGTDVDLIKKVAQQVDDQMKQYSEKLYGVPTVNLAILTALNFAEALAIQTLKSNEPELFVDNEIKKMINFAEEVISKNQSH